MIMKMFFIAALFIGCHFFPLVVKSCLCQTPVILFHSVQPTVSGALGWWVDIWNILTFPNAYSRVVNITHTYNTDDYIRVKQHVWHSNCAVWMFNKSQQSPNYHFEFNSSNVKYILKMPDAKLRNRISRNHVFPLPPPVSVLKLRSN